MARSTLPKALSALLPPDQRPARHLECTANAPERATQPRKPQAVPKLPAITEKRFMAQVVELARLHGWRTYHTHDSRRSDAGFPDLVLVRRPRIVVAELKREDGQATQAQLDWLAEFRACGVPAYLWRPSQWSEIAQALSMTPTAHPPTGGQNGDE